MSIDAMKLALHTLEGWANHGEWVWPESALEKRGCVVRAGGF